MFLAYDADADRPVAIKTFDRFGELPAAERESARARFLRAARQAASLDHPAIARVLDVGEHDGIPFVVTEYVEGESLERYCRPDSLLPVPTACAIVAHAAEGLAHAHERGVVHGAIKPADLVRVGEAGVRILDFGPSADPTVHLAQDAGGAGAPSYFSPEQIRGEALDGRSDQFSLASVLFELLTGERAFGGDTVSSTVYRVVHEPPGSGHVKLPPALSAVLGRALAKSRDERFPDAAAFAIALGNAGSAGEVERVGRGAPEAPLPGRGRPSGGVRARRSGRGVVVAFVVAIAAVSAVSWWWTSRMREGGRAGDLLAGTAPVGTPLEAFVRTDPPGLAVTLDGRPFTDDRVAIPREPPFGVLETVQGCRTVRHEISLGDAGGEIVLVPDPVEIAVVVDPGIPGATVALNDGPAAPAPASLTLDLCTENRIRVEAPRYRGATWTIPRGATPLEARSVGAAVELAPIPLGTVELPETDVPVTFSVDGRELDGRPRSIELEEGEHVVRAESSRHFLDVEVPVTVRAGQTVRPIASLPRMARVAVQSYPPDAAVSFRAQGGGWRKVGTTPFELQVAAGDYRVRVAAPDGVTREQAVRLSAGTNPPIRVSLVGGTSG